MKNFILFFVVIISLFAMSCERKSGRLNDPKKVAVASKLKSDTILVTPDKIGVTDIKRTFTAYPDCDGGECASVEFVIAIEVKEKLYQVQRYEISYTTKKGEAKKDDKLAILELVHSTLTKIPPQELQVIIVKNEVTKLSTKEKWGDNNRFEQSFVLFEKKTF